MPQQAVGQLRSGGAVKATLEGVADAEFTGRITAVGSGRGHRDPQRAGAGHVREPGGQAAAGHVRAGAGGAGRAAGGRLAAGVGDQPAPYGDSVFVVGQMEAQGGAKYEGVRQQFVKLGATRGDQVAVVSGVKPGESVVTSGVFKLRNGAAVKVNNSVVPGNDPAPKPEDN